MAIDYVEVDLRREQSAEPSWTRHIELVVQSLQTRLGASVAPDVIRAEVEAGFAAYSHARIREFVPLLVETRVRSRLSAARPTTPDRTQRSI